MSNPALEPPVAANARRKYVLGLPFWLWVLFAAAVAIGLLHTLLGDRGVANGITGGVLIITGFLCLNWFTFFSAYSRATRYLTAGVIVILVGGLMALVRIEGLSGNIIPTLAFRYSPRPIDREPALPTVETAARVDLRTTTRHDFPRFLGPKGDESVPNIKLERDWTAHPPKEIWRQPIGAGWSGFAVVNGFAVTMEQRGATEMVTCYDLQTGKLQWAHGVNARYDALFGGIGPRCTPTIHQGRVYALGATGRFHCLDGDTGQEVWSKDLLKEFGMTPDDEFALVRHGRSNSPLIVDDQWVVIPAGGPVHGERYSLAAFHVDRGALIWKGGDHNVSYASPVLATLGGVRQILSVNEDQVSGHDPLTGAELWQFNWPGTTSNDANVSQPVPVPPNRVFVSKGYGGGAKLVELEPKEDGTFGVREIYHQNRSMRTKFTNVAIRDGFVYGLSDGILECMKLDTGKKVWRDGAYGHGQILRVDDLLLVLSEEGELALIEATPDRPNNVLGSVRALTGKTWNNLALYGEYLLVRNGQEAVCYRLALRE